MQTIYSVIKLIIKYNYWKLYVSFHINQVRTSNYVEIRVSFNDAYAKTYRLNCNKIETYLN